MPTGTAVDPLLWKFVEVSRSLSANYATHLEGWHGSEFEWILTLPSRTRGAVGEQLVERWLIESGLSVRKAPHSGCDRIVDGVNTEIKFSTLWRSGVYKFQQLRDQDYELIFLIGISPATVHAWSVPKAVAWERSVPQHGGASGKDTRWLSFAAANPPDWLAPFGGDLARALQVLKSRGNAK